MPAAEKGQGGSCLATHGLNALNSFRVFGSGLRAVEGKGSDESQKGLQAAAGGRLPFRSAGVAARHRRVACATHCAVSVENGLDVCIFLCYYCFAMCITMRRTRISGFCPPGFGFRAGSPGVRSARTCPPWQSGDMSPHSKTITHAQSTHKKSQAIMCHELRPKKREQLRAPMPILWLYFARPCAPMRGRPPSAREALFQTPITPKRAPFTAFLGAGRGNGESKKHQLPSTPPPPRLRRAGKLQGSSKLQAPMGTGDGGAAFLPIHRVTPHNAAYWGKNLKLLHTSPRKI
jgi:hypothetical protein